MTASLTFTTDEEMADLEDRDCTVSIVGYIDAIIAPTPAGKNKTMLFKFIVTNGNKNIEVLIWDQVLINKYLKEISSRRIVNINGAFCRAVSQTKRREETNTVPFEIIIKENTTITFAGYYGMMNDELANKLQIATFDTIQNFEGLIQISGYIRTKFSVIHNRSGSMTYGVGAITNGQKKLTVQVKNFQESSLEIGDCISVIGTVKGQDSLVTVFCDSMDSITLKPDVESLSLNQIQHASRPVKRIRSAESNN